MAGLTALSALINPARFFGLPGVVSALFAIAVVSGLAQWIVFQRRRFNSAVKMFGVTILAGSLACVIHAAYLMPDCSKGCTLVVVTPAR